MHTDGRPIESQNGAPEKWETLSSECLAFLDDLQKNSINLRRKTQSDENSVIQDIKRLQEHVDGGVSSKEFFEYVSSY